MISLILRFSPPRPPSTYLLRRCLGWVWRVQIPSEEVLGGVGSIIVNILRMKIKNITSASWGCSLVKSILLFATGPGKNPLRSPAWAHLCFQPSLEGLGVDRRLRAEEEPEATANGASCSSKKLLATKGIATNGAIGRYEPGLTTNGARSY